MMHLHYTLKSNRISKYLVPFYNYTLDNYYLPRDSWKSSNKITRTVCRFCRPDTLSLLLSTLQGEVLLKPSKPQDDCNICFCFVATNSAQKPNHTLSINLWRKLEAPCGLIALFIIHTAAIFAPKDAEPCVKNKAPPTSSNPLASFLFEESLRSLPPSGVRASKLPSWGISDVLSVAKYFSLSASGTCTQ